MLESQIAAHTLQNQSLSEKQQEFAAKLLAKDKELNLLRQQLQSGKQNLKQAKKQISEKDRQISEKIEQVRAAQREAGMKTTAHNSVLRQKDA